jgi:hypothetical protein
MNVLIFTQEEYNKVTAIQEGQHRIAPVALTNGTYFVMEDVLTEMPEGIFAKKLDDILYSVTPFDNIKEFIPVSEILANV